MAPPAEPDEPAEVPVDEPDAARTSEDVGADDDSFVTRQRERMLRQVDDAGRWVADQRPVSVPIDILVRFYERDRDSFGSVLGSALAFRLFLFLVPLVLLVLGIASLLVGQNVMSEDQSDTVGISGQLAIQVQQSLRTHPTTSWLLLGSGLFGAIWAGRGLTKVLSAISARAWELEAAAGRASVKVMGSVTGMLVLIAMFTAILNRVRDASGLAVASVSLLGVLVIYAVAWFFLTLWLPRATSDPGSVLPGAALVGLTSAGLQWFGQFYIPERVGSKSEVLGGLGVTVVALGWLFILARMMAASLVLNAVIYERLGSVSGLVFGLPVLRRIPRRYPRVARFFDLAVDSTPDRRSSND